MTQSSAIIATDTATQSQASITEQQWQQEMADQDKKNKRRQKFVINGAVQLFTQTMVNGNSTKIKGIDDEH